MPDNMKFGRVIDQGTPDQQLALGVARTRPFVVNIDALSAEATSVLRAPNVSWSRWLGAADDPARTALKVQIIRNPGFPYMGIGLLASGATALVSTCAVRAFGGFDMQDAHKSNLLLPHIVSATGHHPYMSVNASGDPILDTAMQGVEWLPLHKPDNSVSVVLTTSAIGSEVQATSVMSAPIRRIATNGARVRTEGADYIAVHVVDPTAGPTAALVFGFFTTTP